MTLKQRLEHLDVRDGDTVKFCGECYLFRSDPWLFGALYSPNTNERVMSPVQLSNCVLPDGEPVLVVRSRMRSSPKLL